MIVAIHQPQYLPWIGFFDKMDRADIFVYLDNVQFKKNEWQNRNRIQTARGWQWVTVPVLHRHPQRISEVLINNKVNWSRKHINAFVTNYSKAPDFNKYRAVFEDFYGRAWKRLVDLNCDLIELLKDLVGIETTALSASELKTREEPTERLIDICKELECDTYLSGPAGANYMRLNRFKEENIHVIFQEFHHPVYPQVYGDFLPHLSIVDLLFNCGEESLDIIRRERRTSQI